MDDCPHEWAVFPNYSPPDEVRGESKLSDGRVAMQLDIFSFGLLKLGNEEKEKMSVARD